MYTYHRNGKALQDQRKWVELIKTVVKQKRVKANAILDFSLQMKYNTCQSDNDVYLRAISVYIYFSHAVETTQRTTFDTKIFELKKKHRFVRLRLNLEVFMARKANRLTGQDKNRRNKETNVCENQSGFQFKNFLVVFEFGRPENEKIYL